MKNIWISGSINSGKSTVAKILAKKMKLALIELDVFSDFLPNMPLEDKITINLNLAIEAVKIYNKNGIETLCVYPLSQVNFDYIKRKIKNLNVYTLDLPLDLVLKNRGQRVLNKKEKDRIRHHYSKGINDPKFGVVIDTDNLSPNQVVSLIIK